MMEPLLRSVIERLAISEAVARAKFDSGAPVQDAPRERALLDAVANQASRYGVTDAQARVFFRDQIEAGKLLQTVLLTRWQRAGKAPGHSVGLAGVLRPRLDSLSGEMLAQLGRVCAPSGDTIVSAAGLRQARERLAHEYRLDALQRAALHRATSSLAGCAGAGDAEATAVQPISEEVKARNSR